MERAKIPVTYPAALSPRELARWLSSFTVPNAYAVDCWIWRGERSARGYGRFRLDLDGSTHRGAMRYAHRLMLMLTVGIRLDQEADHTCGRGRDGCVSPYHLRAVAWETNLAARYGQSDTLTDEEAAIEFVDPDPAPRFRDVDDVPEIPF